MTSRRFHTCVVHDNDSPRIPDCLQDGKCVKRIESSATSVSNHGSSLKPLALIHSARSISELVLTESLIDTQDLIRIQARVATRQNHNASSRCSPGRGHLLKRSWCFIALCKLSGHKILVLPLLKLMNTYLLRASISTSGPVTILLTGIYIRSKKVDGCDV